MMSPSEPPGPPGRKIEYFLRRPRHGAVALMFVGNAVLSLAVAVTQWTSGNQRVALAVCALSATFTVAGIAMWRAGQRQQDAVWTDIHIDDAKVVSKPDMRLKRPR